MDKEKIELLRELLTDPEVRETLKTVFSEEDEKPKSKPKAKAKRKPRAKKQTKENKFVDDLTEGVVEKDSEGNEINLLEIQKKIPTHGKTRPRPKKKTKVCPTCKEKREYFLGYMCLECLRGTSA